MVGFRLVCRFNRIHFLRLSYAATKLKLNFKIVHEFNTNFTAGTSFISEVQNSALFVETVSQRQ